MNEEQIKQNAKVLVEEQVEKKYLEYLQNEYREIERCKISIEKQKQAIELMEKRISEVTFETFKRDGAVFQEYC